MGEYSITFARSARRELEALSPGNVRRILPRIEALADQPRPSGCRKLRGEQRLWRIHVGEYRVIYGILDQGRIVDVVAVRHRSEAY